MTTTMDEMNAGLRNAVRARLDATPDDDPKMAGYKPSPLAGCEPAQQCAAEVLSRVTCYGCGGQPEQVTLVCDAETIQAAKDAFSDRQTGDGLLSETYADWDTASRVGTTAKFGTGAVRSDTVEDFRYDLVSPIGLREVARACAEGAAKYGDWNWEKGMPVHDLLNHAIAHIYGFLAGDRSEPHLGHAAWNLLAAIHSNELWPALNDGTLRGDGCKAPLENAK